MRHGLLSVTLACLAGAGCRAETVVQRCDRLRTEALKAIRAYAEPRWTEGERLEDERESVMTRWTTAQEISRQLMTAKFSIRCGYLRFVHAAPQPTQSAMERMIEKMQPAVDAGRMVSGALADERPDRPAPPGRAVVHRAEGIPLAGRGHLVRARAPGRPADRGKGRRARQGDRGAGSRARRRGLGARLVPGNHAQRDDGARAPLRCGADEHRGPIGALE